MGLPGTHAKPMAELAQVAVVHVATHCPPEHMGVEPPHVAPVVCTRQPFEPIAHVTGALAWHVVPAAEHSFVQHWADPAEP